MYLWEDYYWTVERLTKARGDMHRSGGGLEKARLTAEVLRLIGECIRKKQAYLDWLIEADTQRILNHPWMRRRFQELFDGKYKIQGVFAPSAKDIDGVKKGEPMSHYEANANRANPKFRRGVDDEYSRNCQTCVLAYELRRRGYDVMAGPRDDLGTAMAATLVSVVWVDPETKTYPVRRINAKVQTQQQAVEWFEETVKQGERYQLCVTWENTTSAHTVVLMRNNVGELVIYDPQTGEHLIGSGPILKRFMSHVSIQYSEVNGFSPYLYRIDNALVNIPFVQKIIRRAS